MKKIIMALLLVGNIQAGFYSSDYFEAGTLCGVGAVVGYMTDQQGDNPALTAALYCGILGGAGYITTQYFKGKIEGRNIEELENLKNSRNEYERELTNSAIRGDVSVNYGLISEEEIPAQNMKGLGVVSPTRIIKISK